MGTADLMQHEAASQLNGWGIVCLSSRYCREKCLRMCFFAIFTEAETVYEVVVHHKSRARLSETRKDEYHDD